MPKIPIPKIPLLSDKEMRQKMESSGRTIGIVTDIRSFRQRIIYPEKKLVLVIYIETQ